VSDLPVPLPVQPAASVVIDVAAGLIFRDGKLLITQRKAGSHLAGLWEFPGGKREAGESWDACLRRELHEELAVAVGVGRLFNEVTHAYPEKTVHLRFFVCSLIAGEPQPIDCAAVAWVTAEELKRYQFPAADAVLLEALPQAAEFSRNAPA
jgi:8-oxo-dGTP diphosphatase